MAKNPFLKTAKQGEPYAVYRSWNGSFEWHVLKTYKMAKNEKTDPYARWYVKAYSPACPNGELGDTYAADVLMHGRLAACTPEWREHYETV